MASSSVSTQNAASVVIESPQQNPAACPVEHSGQIDKAARHRDVMSIAHIWFGPRDLDAVQSR
jgi:hypothetical protein